MIFFLSNLLDRKRVMEKSLTPIYNYDAKNVNQTIRLCIIIFIIFKSSYKVPNLAFLYEYFKVKIFNFCSQNIQLLYYNIKNIQLCIIIFTIFKSSYKVQNLTFLLNIYYI